MKGIRVLAVVVVIALIFTFPIPESEGSSDDPLCLYEVFPYSTSEGFSILNYSTREMDLRGYTVHDNVGTVSFTLSLKIPAGGIVTILMGTPDTWYDHVNPIIVNTNGVTQKSFALNNTGDRLILKNSGGAIVDAFVYGNGTPDGGWVGDSFKKLNENNFARRTSPIDTDSAKDWTLIVRGHTSLQTDEFQADVIPFTLPESRGEHVMDALMEADEEVLISIYLLDHKDVVSILYTLLTKGVTVRILLEGSPVGGTGQEMGYMATLADNGADVNFIKNVNGYKRYSYLHNKYAVIDSDTVIVTSENWRESSFNGNRGWGAILYSEEYAEYMRNVFLGDIDNAEGDIQPFLPTYNDTLRTNVTPYYHTDIEYPTYSATIYPMITPDFAYGGLYDLIGTAERRVYSQQLGVDYGWISDDSPVLLMASLADDGVDARLMIDVTFDSPNDSDLKDGYGIRDAMVDRSLNVMTGKESNFKSLIHNKGVIVDDIAWVGSMNWNPSSFGNNREVGVKIVSKAVADFYAAAFIADWGAYTGTMELNVAVSFVDNNVVLDAATSIVAPGSLYEWDIDSDGIADRTGRKIIVSLPVGTRTCVLMVTDDVGQIHTYEFEVNVPAPSENNGNGNGNNDENEDDPPSPYLKYLPIVAICVIVIALRFILRK